MYINHKPADHAEWQRKKKYWADRKLRNGSDEGNKACGLPLPSTGAEPKIIPTEKLKKALMKIHGMLEMQADAFLANLS